MGGANAEEKKPQAKPEATAAAPAEATKAAKGGKKEKVEGEVKARQTFVRERGTKWTLARCMKYAKRYQSEQEWVNGSPASYKAASYWNWVDQCCAHMPKNLRLVHSAVREAASQHPTTTTKPNFQVVQGQRNAKSTETHTATAKADTNVRPLEKKNKPAASKAAKTSKKKAS
jgi:hypothetical protein